MKKATLNAIYSYLSDNGFASTAIMDELRNEINRGAEVKAKNAEAYEAIHDLIMGNLSDTPVTCGELYDAIESELPEGMTKGKVQYALTHLWQDEIVKVSGKPNGYKKA